MKMRTLLIAVLALVLVCSTVRAADYFVSPTGNDAGAGTIADPWASPNRGAGFALQGVVAAGVTVLPTRHTQGWLPSGNINIPGYGTVAYTSKGLNSFNLAAPLPWTIDPGASYLSTRFQDGDIMGGVGLQPGDTVNLRAGTYSNQFITLNNSGSLAGGDITYKSYDGEGQAHLNNANSNYGTYGPWGVIRTVGGDQWAKVEYITLDGLSIRSDENLGGSASIALGGGGLNSSTIKNCHWIGTGSAGNGYALIRLSKSHGNVVQNSTLWSKYSFVSEGYFSGSMHIEYSVIGGRYGAAAMYAGNGLTGDHLTIVDLGTAGGAQASTLGWNDETDAGGNYPTDHYLTNSIFVGMTDANATAGRKGGGDYNNFYNNTSNYLLSDGTTIYWNDGAGAGANDISVDPGFIAGGFLPAIGTQRWDDPDWLRYDWSNACATASDTGSWIGAFEPVPEPATLALLLVSGLGAALLRRK